MGEGSTWEASSLAHKDAREWLLPQQLPAPHVCRAAQQEGHSTATASACLGGEARQLSAGQQLVRQLAEGVHSIHRHVGICTI